MLLLSSGSNFVEVLVKLTDWLQVSPKALAHLPFKLKYENEIHNTGIINVTRDWTIPWSVYAAGFLYAFMYWSDLTDTAWGGSGRKKRDGYSAGSDGLHGKVGESDGKLNHDGSFQLTQCLALESVLAVVLLHLFPCSNFVHLLVKLTKGLQFSRGYQNRHYEC